MHDLQLKLQTPSFILYTMWIQEQLRTFVNNELKFKMNPKCTRIEHAGTLFDTKWRPEDMFTKKSTRIQKSATPWGSCLTWLWGLEQTAWLWMQQKTREEKNWNRRWEKNARERGIKITRLQCHWYAIQDRKEQKSTIKDSEDLAIARRNVRMIDKLQWEM